MGNFVGRGGRSQAIRLVFHAGGIFVGDSLDFLGGPFSWFCPIFYGFHGGEAVTRR